MFDIKQFLQELHFMFSFIQKPFFIKNFRNLGIFHVYILAIKSSEFVKYHPHEQNWQKL